MFWAGLPWMRPAQPQRTEPTGNRRSTKDQAALAAVKEDDMHQLDQKAAPTGALITHWPKSLAAWERSKASLAGGVSTGLRAAMPPHPLSFEQGFGARLRDVDGNEYTDYVLGWGPLFLGHSHPEVLEAVGAQLQRGQTFGAGHHFEYEAAEKVLAAVPDAERVLWSNTGTEANQSAFRLARAFTGRQRIVKFVGHYHGWTDNVLISFRGLEAEKQPAPGYGTNGQSAAAMSDVSVALWNNIESLRALLDDPAENIAAVILEPVLANTGVIAANPDFLRAVRDLCDQTGTVLIFDEVITGFRLALGGAREHFRVKPDLSIFAKGIASGFSLAAISGRADIIDLVGAGVVHAGTYNGNPIALAAADATLGYLLRTTPHARVIEQAARLERGLREALEANSVIGSVHSVGPIVQLALGRTSISTVSDYLSVDWGIYDALIVELLRRGQFVLPGGRFYLSTEHTDAHIAGTISAAQDALAALVDRGELATH